MEFRHHRFQQKSNILSQTFKTFFQFKCLTKYKLVYITDNDMCHACEMHWDTNVKDVNLNGPILAFIPCAVGRIKRDASQTYVRQSCRIRFNQSIGCSLRIPSGINNASILSSIHTIQVPQVFYLICTRTICFSCFRNYKPW